MKSTKPYIYALSVSGYTLPYVIHEDSGCPSRKESRTLGP